jgi:hypothetical protein
MSHPDIATALVTEPPLMALVVFAGLAFAALAAAAVIHANTDSDQPQGGRHERMAEAVRRACLSLRLW